MKVFHLVARGPVLWAWLLSACVWAGEIYRVRVGGDSSRAEMPAPVIQAPVLHLATPAPLAPQILGTLDNGEIPEPQPQPPDPVLQVERAWRQGEGANPGELQRISPLAPEPPPAETPLTPEELQRREEARTAALQRWRENRPRFFAFSATVHDGRLTFVRWWHKGIEYRAWSNVNFHHFTVLRAFLSTDGVRCTGLWTVGDAYRPRAGGLQPRPAAEPAGHPLLPADRTGFVLVQGDNNDVEALRDIEALHLLHQTEGANLQAAWEQKWRAQAERTAWLKANPPPPRKEVLRYWRGDEAPAAPQTEQEAAP